ncbi:unnamed protein product [Trichogramma brassicae]|uniref:Uncharacterized protein n=1 Tax=Trichogramma brassicae TaxID=86971 RepID=A0A6H5I285_9HYME|nr:unnamed protein product [Trichogramma brassicae]
MNLSHTRKRCLLVIGLILVPCIVVNYISAPDTREEQILQNGIAELQVKLENLHSKYISSQEEIQMLTYQLIQLTEGAHQLMPDVQMFVNNSGSNVTNVKLPSVYNFLPHLLNDINSLKPSYVKSKGRTGVSMVLGIPTVKREVQSYLLATLKNLLERMSQKETDDTLIVVLIAEKRCKIAKAELWIHYKPSLFQHVGTHSSLKGKVQKLKDKQFGKISLFYSHYNPEAVIETQIKAYKQFTLKRAYKGDSFFWGLLPQPGDHLRFKFMKPIYIKRYLFRSGNAEHPSDKFYNTTVEVLPYLSNSVDRNHNNVTEDGYFIVGKFDSLGIARGTVDRKLGKISILRLTVHSESDNWAILSEVSFEPYT